MIRDLLNTYGKYFEDDEILLANYELADGIYVKINSLGKVDNILEINKDNREGLKGSEEYIYFKKRDIYSNYINVDKSINTAIKEIKEYKTGKKIFSATYLALFFKNDVVEDIAVKKDKEKTLPLEIFKQVINKYYNSICSLGKDKKEKMILDSVELPEDNTENIEKVKNIFINNIQDIVDNLKEIKMKPDTRIKIYYDASVEEYKNAIAKYIAIKVFNDNSMNEVVDNIVFGCNNYNFGMNSKKPYLEMKSTPFKVQSRLTLDEIIKLRKIYIWLFKNWLDNNEKMSLEFDMQDVSKNESDNAFYLIKNENNNGNAEIKNFEYIPQSTNEIKEFIYKNYINSCNIEGYKINRLDVLEEKISKEIFSNCLYKGYGNKKDIASLKIETYKKKLLNISGDAFYDFFKKYNSKPLRKQISKIVDIIIKESLILEITDKDFSKYKSLLNTTKKAIMAIGLEEYIQKEGDESMENKLCKLTNEACEIINEDKHIENDEQFFFLVGQLSYYLLTQSKANKLNQDVIEPILSCTNLKKLKDEIEFLYKKYKHEIPLRSKRFNSALKEVLVYETEAKVKENTRLILIGILADNIFYTKKEVNGGNENGENE